MNKTNEKYYKKRWHILFAVVIMTFMACLDSSIINVALPVISEKLNVTMASIQWIITSYLIIISGTILTFGRLGDIKGKSKIFKYGIIMFTLGSLFCGISKTLWELIIARILQAIGASATMANNQGIITNVFPSNERGRALGILGTFVALGTMVGPPLGGFIVSFRWEYIFFINVPIGLIGFFMAIKILPKFEGTSKEKLDIKGTILFMLSIIALVMSITQGELIGYTKPIIIFGLVISVIAFSLFIIVQKTVKSPLISFSIFKNKLFSLSLFCGFISFMAINCLSIIQPFYLQDVMVLTPAATGVFMMVYPIILSVVSPSSGYLSDRIGAELPAFLGLLVTSIGLLFMSTLNATTPLWILAVYTVIISLGNGLFQSPNNSLVMSTVPNDKLGIAGSINGLVRTLGMIFGITLSTTLLYNRMSYKIGYTVSTYIKGRNDIFIYGMRYVYIVATIICVIGALLSAIRLFKRKK